MIDMLIFDIIGGLDMVEAVVEFSNSANTREINYQDGHGENASFLGYTKLFAAIANDSMMRIQLAKEA